MGLQNLFKGFFMAFGIGFVLSFVIAYPAYKKNSLSFSGLLAALSLGALLYFLSSLLIFSTMIVFFVSSSLLSKFKKKDIYDKNIVDKGSCRDYIQVFANGGVALIFASLYKISNNELFLSGAVIAFACANADTWASEIGSQSNDIPIYIFKREPVDIGLSGGVTKLGFIASFCGSSLISLWYVSILIFEKGFQTKYLFLLLLVSVAGFVGSVIDSFLGEIFQAKFVSWKDGKSITELAIEDFKKNKIVSGIKWIDNNLINFLSGLISSILGVLVAVNF